MKSLLLVLATLFLCASPARADDRGDAEKVVRAYLGGSNDALAKGAQVLVNGAASKAWQTDLGGTLTIDKLYVEAETLPVYAVAWFHGRGTLAVGGKKVVTRFNGIATAENGWRVVASAHSLVVPDAELLGHAGKLAIKLVAPAAPKLIVTTDAEKSVAETVAGWLTKASLAKSYYQTMSGAPSKVLASGTSASEDAEGDAAKKLAASWDALKLRPVEIEAKFINSVYWVRAVVAMPVPHQKYAAPLVLTAVLEGGGMSIMWKSLHWADGTLAK
jgi:hypothetical protein